MGKAEGQRPALQAGLMMKGRDLFLLSLLCAGRAAAGFGDGPPPEAYVDPVDQQIARTAKGIPGRPYPCAREEQQGIAKVIVPTPTETCMKMQPQRHWRGLWLDEFRVLASARSRRKVAPSTRRVTGVWLEMAEIAGRDAVCGRVHRPPQLIMKAMAISACRITNHRRSPYFHEGGCGTLGRERLTFRRDPVEVVGQRALELERHGFQEIELLAAQRPRI